MSCAASGRASRTIYGAAVDRRRSAFAQGAVEHRKRDHLHPKVTDFWMHPILSCAAGGRASRTIYGAAVDRRRSALAQGAVGHRKRDHLHPKVTDFWMHQILSCAAVGALPTLPPVNTQYFLLFRQIRNICERADLGIGPYPLFYSQRGG